MVCQRYQSELRLVGEEAIDDLIVLLRFGRTGRVHQPAARRDGGGGALQQVVLICGKEREIGFLHNVLDSGRHLLHLIDNLLDLSKIEAGRMEVHAEDAELRAVVDGVCTIMEGYCRERHVTIAQKLPPYVFSDLIRVKLVKAMHGDSSGVRGAAWLFGPESHGLPSELAKMATHRVRIPMPGSAESLNVASAASICLYQSARTHRHD